MNVNTKKNISTSLISFFISIFMTLWFTPFIIKNLGVEAYGYTTLIQNMINVTTVITLAITSMSSRYISIELQRNRLYDANRYFNSILFTLLILSGFLLFFFILVLINLEDVINVSDQFISDVKLLFFISSLQFLIGVITTPFLGGVYFQNKLRIIYNFNIINYGFKFLLSIVIFNYFRPILWIPNIAILFVSIVSFIFYLNSYKNMMPGVSIDISKYNISYALKVIKSGFWISISKAGSILLGTLNVYFSNIFIGPQIAGVYAAVMQLQTLAIVLVNAIVPSFIPEMYKKFAENKIDLLIHYAKKSILLLSLPLGVVIGGMLAFGNFFMMLWLGQEFGQYELMFFLVIVYLPFILPAEVLNQLNITMNKVKGPALVTLLFGILNVILIIILFKYTNLGIFSVIISQLVTTLIRGGVYFPIYSAKVAGVKLSTFYPEIAIGGGVTCLTYGIGLIIRNLFYPNSWGKLVLCAILTVIIVILIIFLFMNKEKKRLIKGKVLYLLRIKK